MAEIASTSGAFLTEVTITEYLGGEAMADGSGAIIAFGDAAGHILTLDVCYGAIEGLLLGLDRIANAAVDAQIERGTLLAMPGRAPGEPGLVVPDIENFRSFVHGAMAVVKMRVKLGGSNPPVTVAGQVDRAGLQAARDDLTETLWELHQREAGLN